MHISIFVVSSQVVYGGSTVGGQLSMRIFFLIKQRFHSIVRPENITENPEFGFQDKLSESLR